MVSKGKPGSCPHRTYVSGLEDRWLGPLQPSGIKGLLVGMQMAGGPWEAPNPVGAVREDTDPKTKEELERVKKTRKSFPGVGWGGKSVQRPSGGREHTGPDPSTTARHRVHVTERAR